MDHPCRHLLLSLTTIPSLSSSISPPSLDLFGCQPCLKALNQHHSLKSSSSSRQPIKSSNSRPWALSQASFKLHQPPQVLSSCTQDEGRLRVPRTKILLPRSHAVACGPYPLSLEYRVPHAASDLCLCRSPTHPSNFACCASDLPPYAQCFFCLPLLTSAVPVRACKHLVFAVSYVTCYLCSMNYLL
ncbi:hypothetical protein DFH08DRAFT_389173 [Mycena albidolilacea]|uniref:Uncharacterized protein n=1 Tax=Mycena albidolilacea TaxID=1033008 RepID=A0AAD7EFM4_9AGAR|nr:hypothetical protein DFH08DRAFT_389173 [Mycena albidolilacea]